MYEPCPYSERADRLFPIDAQLKKGGKFNKLVSFLSDVYLFVAFDINRAVKVNRQFS